MNDADWMRRALELARQAERIGEVPVGAVLVCDDAMVAAGHNRMITDQDPSAHAEIVALRAAGRREGNYRLPGCTLYVTLEPCLMCAGAIIHARIERLVYGASDPKTGACGGCFALIDDPRHNHRVQVEGGVLGDQAATMLREFFAARRLRVRPVAASSDAPDAD